MTDRFDLTGRIVIITGGGKGIGKIYARGIRQSRRARRCRRHRWRGGRGRWPKLSRRKARWRLGLATDIAERGRHLRYGARRRSTASARIDVLINNASLMSVLQAPLVAGNPARRVGPASWRSTCAGMFLCCRAVFPAMKAARARQDRQHLVGAGVGGHPQPAALHHLQGRGHRLHPRARARSRHGRHHRQRGHSRASPRARPRSHSSSGNYLAAHSPAAPSSGSRSPPTWWAR